MTLCKMCHEWVHWANQERAFLANLVLEGNLSPGRKMYYMKVLRGITGEVKPYNYEKGLDVFWVGI